MTQMMIKSPVTDGSALTITIPPTFVGSDLSDFPLRIDESIMPAPFWTDVAANGRDIVFKDGAATLSRQVIMLDRTEERCLIYVKVPTILSSLTTEITMEYASGADNDNDTDVWPAGYKFVLPIGYGLPRSDITGNAELSRMGNDRGVVDKTILIGNLSDAKQGIAFDGTYYYVSDTNGLYKYNTSWALQATNADPNGDLTATVDHCGDIDVYDGKLYTVQETFLGASSTGQTIGVFDPSDLSYITEHDISAQGHEASGLVIEPDEDRITITSFSAVDDGKLFRYKFSDFSYVGILTLSEDVDFKQGIARRGDHYYISSNVEVASGDSQTVVKVALSGKVVAIIYSKNEGTFIEGVTFNGDDLILSDHTGGTNNAVYKLVFTDEMEYSASVSEIIEYDLDSSYQTGYLTFWGETHTNVQMASGSIIDRDSSEVRVTVVIDNGNSFGTWNNISSWLYPSPTIDPSLDTLHQFATTFTTGGNRHVFYNGEDKASGSAGTLATTMDQIIIASGPGWGSDLWNGNMREVRLSSAIPSDDWIAFEDANVRNTAGIIIA